MSVQLLSVGFFGLLGVFSRYFLGLLISKIGASTFPWSTFIINLSGSFLIGIISVIAREKSIIPIDIGTGILIGFLGGFTTFSSYCLEAFKLFEEGEWLKALFYLGGSSIIGFILTFLGIIVTRRILTQ